MKILGSLIVVPFLLVIAVFFVILSALVLLARSLAVRLGGWTKSYTLLAKRYGTTVKYSQARPRINFSYGDTVCYLRNLSSAVGKNARTQLSVTWHDRSFKLFISTHGTTGGRRLRQVEFEHANLDESANRRFEVYSNQPAKAREMITPSAQWQIQQ